MPAFPTPRPLAPPVAALRPAWLLLWCWLAGTAAADTLKVELTGVKGELRRNLVEHLAAVQGDELDKLSSGRIRAMHRQAPAALEEALQALGYYEARVEPSLTRDANGWRAQYAVTRGEPVLIAALTIDLIGEAAQDDAFADRLQKFPLAVGDRLVHSRWEDGKRALERQLADRGYFDARIVKTEVRVQRARRSARALLSIDSGPRYRFGEVLWPRTRLAPAFLARYVNITPGAPFSAREMLDFQARLTDSNYFGSVLVEPRTDLAEDERVPLEVELEMRPARRYSVGAGFGTDTGPRARAAWQRPWVNERGHRAEVDLRLSQVQSTLSGLYSMPRASRWTDSIDLTTELSNEDTDAKKALTLRVGAAHLTTRFGWREAVGLEYEVESYDVAESGEIAGLLVPSARWTRTWTDDPIYTRNGLRLGLGIRGAHSALLSSTSFAQIRIDAKYVRALGGMRLILRSEFGAVAAEDFDKLPASERFFAGGDTNLRGFDYQSLGPRTDRGKVEGGQYLMLGSVEVEQKIVGNWSAAAFTDVGNALNDLSDPIACGVGVGVRWLSPVGLVRVDLANGISSADSPWRIHVVVGPDL